MVSSGLLMPEGSKDGQRLLNLEAIGWSLSVLSVHHGNGSLSLKKLEYKKRNMKQ